jgi:hypothetical protein
MAVVGLTTTHRPDELEADAIAATLSAVYFGRVDRPARGGQQLEIFVVEP